MGTKNILPEFQDFILAHKLAPEKHVLFLAIREQFRAKPQPKVGASKRVRKENAIFLRKNELSPISHLQLVQSHL